MNPGLNPTTPTSRHLPPRLNKKPDSQAPAEGGSELEVTLGAALLGGSLLFSGAAAEQAQTVSTSVVVEQASEKLDAVERASERTLDPGLTDPQIKTIRGPHEVITPSGPGNGFLLLSLGGTNSIPKDFLPFDRVAAEEGFTALALDYPNTVITTACQNSTQPDPCTLFRQEIVSGQPVSELVEVDSIQSIEHRLEAALRHLADTDPEHFQDFVNEQGPVWKKIVVVGHSQGSGHAGYLAKKHPLQGAIMLAGPQDTTDAGPAGWLSAPSATDPDQYFSFLHRGDFFGSEKQLAVARLLREDFDLSEETVKHQAGSGPVVVTEAPVRDPHMSVLSDEFSEVWRGLLKNAVD